MPLYTCESCNYKSSLLGNYKQHKKSKKHRVNTGELNVMGEETTPKSQKEPEKSLKEPQKSQKEPQKSQENSEFLCVNALIT